MFLQRLLKAQRSERVEGNLNGVVSLDRGSTDGDAPRALALIGRSCPLDCLPFVPRTAKLCHDASVKGQQTEVVASPGYQVAGACCREPQAKREFLKAPDRRTATTGGIYKREVAWQLDNYNRLVARA